MKIGVFDSGIGGLTVLAELRKRFPGATYVYLGDTANVPYGSKSPAQIRKLCAACARTLKGKDVDFIVVACNSASSWALPEIQRVARPIPVIGVVDPGVEAVVRVHKRHPPRSPILVLATRATVSSRAYLKALKKALPGSSSPIHQQACPLLAPMIEEGWTDHPVLHLTLREYVARYKKPGKPGVALLGCTHYPWIQRAVEKALPGWTVVNSATAVADALERLLPVSRTLKGKKKQGRVQQWIFTDPAAVPLFARAKLGLEKRTGGK